MEATLQGTDVPASLTASWQGLDAGVTHKATFSKPEFSSHVRVEILTFKGEVDEDTLPVRVEWARLNILAVLGDPNGRFRMPREALPKGDAEVARLVRQEFNKHFPRRLPCAN